LKKFTYVDVDVDIDIDIVLSYKDKTISRERKERRPA
jgi:hypothetical protein